MKHYQFTIIVQRDEEGNYVAICPALQGCYSEGETPEEAVAYLKDAIQLHIEDRQARNEPIYEELFSQRLDVAA
ncbi:type II toxin-antitoxin system HicB family antitoxin [Spirosoma soli]|uniref:Type II toxin-antitoxin system HicB family antitoxin n=1 Tax=Spirosoma soli TaxID=1770529 RepID=A0ABW5M7X7_9BACT